MSRIIPTRIMNGEYGSPRLFVRRTIQLFFITYKFFFGNQNHTFHFNFPDNNDSARGTNMETAAEPPFWTRIFFFLPMDNFFFARARRSFLYRDKRFFWLAVNFITPLIRFRTISEIAVTNSVGACCIIAFFNLGLASARTLRSGRALFTTADIL